MSLRILLKGSIPFKIKAAKSPLKYKMKAMKIRKNLVTDLKP